MMRKLKAMVGTAVAVAGLAIAPSIDAPAGASTIPVFLAVPATGLTVTGSGGAANLYAWASCGGEFAPLKPTVVADNPATTITPPAAGNVLYGPSTCDSTQPVSEVLAVFGRNMYWVSADGYLQEAPNNSFDTPSREYRLAQLPPLIGGGVAPGVAVDDHAITWTSSNARGMAVYAAWASRAGWRRPARR